MITEPNIATTAKKTVVTINTIIDNKPRKSFVTIIQIIESGVSEKINPGNLNVNPPQVKISFTTLPHKNWLTKVKDNYRADTHNNYKIEIVVQREVDYKE